MSTITFPQELLDDHKIRVLELRKEGYTLEDIMDCTEQMWGEKFVKDNQEALSELYSQYFDWYYDFK